MPTPPHGSPPSVVRLRECGQVRFPGRSFRPVLNVRSVIIEKMLRDTDLNHDARVKLRIKAHELCYEYDEAYRTGEPAQVQKALETAYHDTLDKLGEAHMQRRKWLDLMKETLSMMKEELRRVRVQPCMKLSFD